MPSALINVALCHVVCTYVSTSGAPMSGSVTFTPAPTVILDIDTGSIIAPTPIVATLDNTGSIALDLPATDDPDLNPNNFTYTVSEDLVDGNLAPFTHTYSINAPGNQTLNLANAVPLTSYFGDPILRGPRGPAGDGNVDGGNAATVYSLAVDGGGA